MDRLHTPNGGSSRTAAAIRDRIMRGGEQLWRMEDFRDLPPAAVAQALSRLTQAGQIERLSKGTYYRPRDTAFGKSRPNPTAITKLASRSKALFPSGIAAASLLGFTTQTSGRGEIATNASSLPRKLLAPDTVIHTRRPATWSELSEAETALLDFLRRRGKMSELTPEQTIERTLALLSEQNRMRHLLNVAATEPPRIRAMLGALGEQLKIAPAELEALRSSLNPLSRFDFGIFAALPNARAWQAKERWP